MSFENQVVSETKTCKNCKENFSIYETDLEFYKKISPEFLGEIFLIPTPQFCHNCRMQRRLSCRNERNLYSRKCDQTGKGIISIFSPDKDYRVFNHDYWWSDSWDALDYGIEFNFSKSFFENYAELDRKVPKLSTTIQASENCEYTNDTGDSNNCYLSYRTHYSENISYSYRANRSSNCIDCYQLKESENCYECFQSNKCTNGKYLYKCENVGNSAFLYNCIGSNNCFLCFNQVNANYCFLNKTYSREEYISKVSEVEKDPKKWQEAKNYFFHMIKNDVFFPNLDNSNSDSCYGNELLECNNCFETYMMKQCENSRYAWDNISYQDCMDNYSGGSSSLCYETLANKKCFKNSFTHRIRESNNMLYSMFCFDCDNCFGCIGLRNKSYCIFNKQYDKKSYDQQVSEIIKHMQETGEWGEFFPSSISPFGYNETVAQDYFPFSKDEILSKGLKYSDYENPFPKVDKTIKASQLPENIGDIPDDILNWAVECEETDKPFRITKTELDFYRKFKLPIPKRHPDQRHKDRLKYINERKIYDRKCDGCEEMIKSGFSPDRTESVYCETCYNAKVI